MAYIIRRNQNQAEQNPGLIVRKKEQQETLPQTIGRNLRSTGSRIGSTLETLATLPVELPAYAQDLYQYFAGEESPIQKQLRSIGQPIEHRQPYFQPEPARGFGEEVLQGTLSQLPFVAASGGLNALKGAGTGIGALLKGGAARS